MPCLNEARTVAACIDQIQTTFRKNNIAGEIIVADNGSNDGSPAIAEAAGARVVHVSERGYGSALMAGIEAARGKYVIMGDADCSYDFGHIPRFLEKLRGGMEFVMGNRFRGGIQPGAMKPLHRYLGNPVLTWIGRRLFWSPNCGDFHCGLRGFTKNAYHRMDLRTTGMEFASEMVVKAALFGVRLSEVPTTLAPDGRDRPPHLRSWHDGWRHLRFLLLYSPRWLFFYPGMALAVLGAVAMALLLPAPIVVGGIRFDINTLLYAALAVLLGFQAMAFAVFTKVFAVSERLLPEDARLHKLFRYAALETGILAGIGLIACGFAGSVLALSSWGARQFGALDPEKSFRLIIPSALFLTLGVETVFASFFLSVLRLRRK